jgi:hypothetical protein
LRDARLHIAASVKRRQEDNVSRVKLVAVVTVVATALMALSANAAFGAIEFKGANGGTFTANSEAG